MSSSSDLETGIARQVLQKKIKKTKKKAKQTAPVADPVSVRNEGDDPHWAYAPPDGAVLLDHAVDAGPFEWGAIKDDDDTEIWLIRVPDSVNAKHLDGLEIDAPSSSHTSRIGGITRKTASYDVWSIGDDDVEVATRDELGALTCLLPRKKKKGRLYIAPKQVARRIVVAARPSVATSLEHQPVVCQNPPRPSHPKEMLKHAFVPYGARSSRTRSEDVSMDADEVVVIQDEPAEVLPSPKDKPAKTKDSKGKKRKVEGESPQRSKKHKTKAT